jgi:hypothetical protein
VVGEGGWRDCSRRVRLSEDDNDLGKNEAAPESGEDGVDPTRERELRAVLSVGPDVPVIVLHLRTVD